MLHKMLDLIVVSVISILSFLLGFREGNIVVFQPLIGIAVVCVIPGYAIAMAIFPQRGLDIPELIAYCLGLSLSITILSGVLLNWTPWGIQSQILLGIICTVTILGCIISFVRRMDCRINFDKIDTWKIKISYVFLFSLAALVLLSAFELTLNSIYWQSDTNSSRFWMLPPENITSNNIRLGIVNMEHSVVKYQLLIKNNNQIIDRWTDIELVPGEQWSGIVQLTPRIKTGSVEASLYRLDKPLEVYRTALIWVSAERVK